MSVGSVTFFWGMDEHVLGLFVTLELNVPGAVSVFRGHTVPSVCNHFSVPEPQVLVVSGLGLQAVLPWVSFTSRVLSLKWCS